MILERLGLQTRLVTGVDVDGLEASAVQGPAEPDIIAHGGFKETTNSFPCLSGEYKTRSSTPSGIVLIPRHLVSLVLKNEVLVQRVVDRDVIEILQLSARLRS